MGEALRPVLLVEALRPDQIEAVAVEHMEMLPHGFFTRLGPRFLTAYHRTFVDSPHGVALAVSDDGIRVGALVGTTANRAHYGWVLRQRGPALAARAVAALAVRPREVGHLLRTRWRRYSSGLVRLFRRTGKTPPEDRSRRRGAVGVLTHMWVLPQARGSGAGRALVEAFCETAARAGAREAQLVTLAGDAGAGRFYRRLGWEHRDDRSDPDGRTISVHRITLAPHRSGPARDG